MQEENKDGVYILVPEDLFTGLLNFMRDQPYKKVAAVIPLMHKCEKIMTKGDDKKDG